jgi:hypothetical protein
MLEIFTVQQKGPMAKNDRDEGCNNVPFLRPYGHAEEIVMNLPRDQMEMR